MARRAGGLAIVGVAELIVIDAASVVNITRANGRGETGALDALVVGGLRAAALTVVLELIKGAVVGLGARVYDGDAWFAATAIAGCVVGDAFPVGIRRGRRGGRARTVPQ